MREHWLEERDNSGYSNECDDPHGTIITQVPSTEPSQEHVLDNPDDVQSRHELYKELYYLVLAESKHKRLTNANNERYE